MNISIDRFDIAILEHLQRDAALTNSELSQRVHLSPSQCSRRRLRLEEEGAIAKIRAELDGSLLGFQLSAFIHVALTAHDGDTAELFARFLNDLEDVSSAFAVTGDADYILLVKVRSLDDLSHLINHKLLPHKNVREVRSEIILNKIKENAPLPVRKL